MKSFQSLFHFSHPRYQIWVHKIHQTLLFDSSLTNSSPRRISRTPQPPSITSHLFPVMSPTPHVTTYHPALRPTQLKNLYLLHHKMARRPVLEEVDDDDIDMNLDIAQFDPLLRTPIAPLNQPTITRSQDSEPPLFPNLPMTTPEFPDQKRDDIIDPAKFSEQEREELGRFQIVYPCYFDKNRSHKEGRRVSEEKAVLNPLAKTISDACRQMKIPVLLELDKTHPQDFGNPGRVRVLIKESGKPSDARFSTKKQLLNVIAGYLQEHPTTLHSIGRNSGIPYPSEFEQGFDPEELPRVKGFKMNSIVPVHSNLTLKHPMTKLIYDPQPEIAALDAPKVPKQPKKKIMKIRG